MSKWVNQILELQHSDGSWGDFHTLSRPTKKQPMTTEQALRRLKILGLTAEDEPVQRALGYMRGVLRGEYQTPDRREKVLNWDAFEAHMMAAWIRMFVPDDPDAMPVAKLWSDIVTASFENSRFNEDVYIKAYRNKIPKLNSNERLISLSQFYMVSLLQGMLKPDIEERFVQHIINCKEGIYYIYGFCIADLPSKFASRQTSQWIAALEMIAGYSCSKEKLKYAADWLNTCRSSDVMWDMGAVVKDGIYFPVSDSWRSADTRKKDCTDRINGILRKLG